jgi:CheY-like chemotaxis protein
VNLLLAEDNLPDALLVKEAIRQEKLPVEVYTVTDGEKAIDFLTQAESNSSSPSPDLLILDLNLPRRDGLEILRGVRSSAKFRDLLVLVVTSSDSPSDLRETAALGAGYFRKPPSYDGFLKLGGVLKQMLQEHGLI